MILTGHWARPGQSGELGAGGSRRFRHKCAWLLSPLPGEEKVHTPRQDAGPEWAEAALWHCPPPKSEHGNQVGGPGEPTQLTEVLGRDPDLGTGGPAAEQSRSGPESMLRHLKAVLEFGASPVRPAMAGGTPQDQAAPP